MSRSKLYTQHCMRCYAYEWCYLRLVAKLSLRQRTPKVSVRTANNADGRLMNAMMKLSI